MYSNASISNCYMENSIMLYWALFYGYTSNNPFFLTAKFQNITLINNIYAALIIEQYSVNSIIDSIIAINNTLDYSHMILFLYYSGTINFKNDVHVTNTIGYPIGFFRLLYYIIYIK